MKNGYYISTFLTVDEGQYIYGIKTRHDQAIALWKKDDKNIRLIRYWELERLSGIKMHPYAIRNKETFKRLLKILLDSVGINIDEIQGVWGTKGIETDSSYYHYNEKICFHSIAHIFSSLFFGNKVINSDTNILALSVDAGPDSGFEEDGYDKLFYAGMLIRDGKILVTPIKSPGKIWATAKKIFGLREGTLMALASACKFEIKIDLVKYLSKSLNNFNVKIEAFDILSEIINEVEQYMQNNEIIIDNQFNYRENLISAVMKNVQILSNMIMEENIDRIMKEYKIDPSVTDLALSGGFSLNCPTNAYLMEKYNFKSLIVPPCISDCGIALGVGIGGFWNDILEGTEVFIEGPYLGESDYNIGMITEMFKNEIKSISFYKPEIAAKDIIDEKVVVWFNSNAEIGPRALGNRSLIGDPRYSSTKDCLNIIKKREWWRPVAPIVLDDYGSMFFKNYFYSPYMLLNFNILDNKKEIVPAIQHLDGTCRIQSLRCDDNKDLYELISCFYNKTGIPILCNTSLNDKGEPIVNYIADAIKFAINKNIRIVYINALLRIEIKSSVKNKKIDNNYERNAIMFTNKFIKNCEDELGLTIQELTYYFDNIRLFKNMDLNSDKDKIIIKEKTKQYLDKIPMGLTR